MNVWPLPPEPRPTPWQPDPHPGSPPRSSPPVWHIVESRQDWLAERLFDQRVVPLTGRLDAADVNRAAASLALLDASGDDPVELRLCDVDADLDGALTLIDTLDLMGVPVHATCLGELTGPAVALLAVADRRIAGQHATVRLREPRTRFDGHTCDVADRADHLQRQLRRLQERVAEACHRPVDTVAADMRAGRIMTAEEARGYGLVDTCAAKPAR
ncbi:MAG: ATP-dependent Clp protease proteolytic subunit [Pseudonocardiaceae bacterium]